MRLLIGIVIGVTVGVMFHRQIREQCRQCLDYFDTVGRGEDADEVR